MNTFENLLLAPSNPQLIRRILFYNFPHIINLTLCPVSKRFRTNEIAESVMTQDHELVLSTRFEMLNCRLIFWRIAEFDIVGFPLGQVRAAEPDGKFQISSYVILCPSNGDRIFGAGSC